MILHLMKCEMCDTTHKFEPMAGPAWIQVSDNWLMLLGEGDKQASDGYSFCSRLCLARWLSLHGTEFPHAQPFHSCDTRRFLLVDKKDNITEGVKFANGSVSLDGGSQHCCLDFHCQGYFNDWDTFKSAHEDSCVHWVDLEAKS